MCWYKRTSKIPQQKLYIRIMLQDLKQPNHLRYLLDFQPIADVFLGITVPEIEKMEKIEPDELATILETKIGYTGLFKIKSEGGYIFSD